VYTFYESTSLSKSSFGISGGCGVHLSHEINICEAREVIDEYRSSNVTYYGRYPAVSGEKIKGWDYALFNTTYLIRSSGLTDLLEIANAFVAPIPAARFIMSTTRTYGRVNSGKVRRDKATSFHKF